MRTFIALTHAALFAATLLAIAMAGCAYPSPEDQARQARAAYRHQQLVQASHELDASTIAMFPTISHADRAACLRRANLIAISAEVVRNDVLFGCLRAMEQNQEASHP
jgi:hypothetical protein